MSIGTKPPAEVTIDLHPGNLLVCQGHLSAVIDFGDLAAGDPATDLSVMWMLLPPSTRLTFRASARGESDPVDDHTLMRARGVGTRAGARLLGQFSGRRGDAHAGPGHNRCSAERRIERHAQAQAARCGNSRPSVRSHEPDFVRGSARVAETSAMNSSPNPWRCSSYHSAALRSSARASGCSSRRTSLFEFLQDLGPRGLPADRLNVTFSDLSGTPFQLGRPCRGDFLVRLFQTGKQFLRDTSAVNASEAQGLGKQLVRRHDLILAFAPENRL